MPYSRDQKILLVGEGDFSFSVSLTHAFGSAHNLFCTSLNSRDTLLKSYSNARQNLALLREFGATILHGVDATAMINIPPLCHHLFDRIVFNFPHAGFHGKEDSERMLRKHIALVDGFLKCASDMLSPGGEIHITHKLGEPYDRWHIPNLGITNGLNLIGVKDFNSRAYRGYAHKRGAGKGIDKSFRMGPSVTYKFALMPHSSEVDYPFGERKRELGYPIMQHSSNMNPVLSERSWSDHSFMIREHGHLMKRRKVISEGPKIQPFTNSALPHIPMDYHIPRFANPPLPYHRQEIIQRFPNPPDPYHRQDIIQCFPNTPGPYHRQDIIQRFTNPPASYLPMDYHRQDSPGRVDSLSCFHDLHSRQRCYS